MVWFLRDMLDQYGVRLNIVGRKELFPERVQAAVAQAEKMTRHNSKCVVMLVLFCGCGMLIFLYAELF